MNSYQLSVISIKRVSEQKVMIDERSNFEMTELLYSAIKISVDAGFKIMEIFNDRIRIRIKRNFTPVTNADRAANEFIVEELSCYNIPVISEETTVAPYSERKNWEYLWLVDPLDGTKEFISRSFDFTVNIALIKNNRPVLGVIYAPAYDELYFGSEEIGSFKFENAAELIRKKLSFEQFISLSQKLPCMNTDVYTYLVSKSHINSKTRDYLKKDDQPKQFISKGSSLKLCALAEGSADEYPRFGRTMEWDTAAGDAILQAAGGKIISCADSKLLEYNKADLANPEFIAYRLSN